MAPAGRFKGAAHRLPEEDGTFDVVVAGAGPAGATTAYYLAQYSRNVYAGTPLRIGLLDKAAFPRDKYCGDAWCFSALEIMEDMGVLQELERDGLVCNCLCGGFVSPAGHSFIANDRNTPPESKNMTTRCYAIKRKIADERIARCASRQVGVELVENAMVETAVLDDLAGVWTVTCGDGRVFRARMLVAADGAASAIGRSLGLVTSPPQAVAGRRYVKAGTHNFKADGVLLYPDYTLPGYAALFRHYDDSIDLGLYLLPGGSAKDSDIQDIYENKLMADPFVSRALGPNAQFSERLKVASLRLGGEPRSWGNHVVLVGDAAGQIDPLTGEGIHTGMIGGKLAAETIAELFREGDFSDAACKRYHSSWMREFGRDFALSAGAGKVLRRAPFLMDAVPMASIAKGGKAGSDFFGDFGAVMTGALPKSTFLRPSVAWPLAVESLKQFVNQYLLKSERRYYTDPAQLVAAEVKRQTSWDAQCLIDPTAPVGKPAEDEGEGQLAEAHKYADDRLPPALVLYGTEYGFSHELALSLCERLGERGSCSPRCLNIAHHELVNWDEEDLLFVVCSTAGDGDPPVAAQPFFEALRNGAMAGRLRGLRYAVLAPGDRAYPKFAAAGKELGRLLEGAGATAALLLETLDTEDGLKAVPWFTACCNLDPLPKRDLGQEDYLRQVLRDNAVLLAPTKGATRAAPFMATLSARRLLTSLDPADPDPKETWHIEIDLTDDRDGLVEYLPGDALGVQPLNCEQEVDAILQLLRVPPDARVSAESARELLLRSDLRLSLSELKVDKDEHVIDVLVRDASARSQGLDILSRLKPLQPRYYSIASCPTKDAGSVHLCVAAVRYSLRERGRKGVASTFLIDRVKIGGQMPVWVQRNPSFRPKARSVLIGPGTGLAPFRSFIRNMPESETMLFFGCRNEARDFLYREELRSWAADSDNHDLQLAFSRDTGSKVYVQNRLAEPDVAAKVWGLLSRSDDPAHVFICGEGFRMAGDVKAALFALVVEHSNGAVADEEAAARFLEGRLHLDVWVS